MKYTIFIAEDDEGIRELYECALTGAGYEYVCFERAEDLMDELARKKADLIILDIMLPQKDGVSCLKELKADNSPYKQIPVIMISARCEEHVKVKTLSGGADDYMTKPFGVMELIARIKNILRRNSTMQTDKKEYIYQDLRLNERNHKVSVGGVAIELSPKEYDVLRELISRIGEAVSREQLLNTVWGDGYFGETRTVDIHVAGVRNKLAAFSDKEYIKTVRSVGYMIGE